MESLILKRILKRIYHHANPSAPKFLSIFVVFFCYLFYTKGKIEKVVIYWKQRYRKQFVLQEAIRIMTLLVNGYFLKKSFLLGL